MTETELQEEQQHKYSPWGHKEPLVCKNPELMVQAQAVGLTSDSSPEERAALFLHTLTGCEGLEFIAFSNVKLAEPVRLASDVILYPCYLQSTEGPAMEDPFITATMRMERSSRYIYDGWLRITSWDESTVRESIQTIRTALSLPAIFGTARVDWQPKYSWFDESNSTINLDSAHLKQLEVIVDGIDTLSQPDRGAVFRSIAWLAQSRRASDPVARFLFCILAIESLAMFIEDSAEDDSPLAQLRTDTRTDDEKRVERDQCIKDIVLRNLEDNPTETIKLAYFDCVVGIKRRLEKHMKSLMGSEHSAIDSLFSSEKGEHSLYDLRHMIAHGRLQVLDEGRLLEVRNRLPDAELISGQYLWSVLHRIISDIPPGGDLTASMILDPGGMILSNRGMYRGPTEVALLYSLS
ncbi:hypothetical protein ACFL3H_00265 [Gemmatimonadota bacterium]